VEGDTYRELEISQEDMIRMRYEIEELKAEMYRLKREGHIQRAVRHTPEELESMLAPPPRTRHAAEMDRMDPIWEDARSQIDAYRTILNHLNNEEKEENEGWDK
jgi:hypothetical protein